MKSAKYRPRSAGLFFRACPSYLLRSLASWAGDMGCLFLHFAG